MTKCLVLLAIWCLQVSEIWTNSILPPHGLLNGFGYHNTFLLTKPPPNYLYTDWHTLDQVDVICKSSVSMEMSHLIPVNSHCSLLNLSPRLRGKWALQSSVGKSFSLETFVTGIVKDA